LSVHGILGLLSAAKTDSIAAILVSIGDRPKGPNTAEIAALAEAFPEIPLLGVVQIDSIDRREIVPAIKAGVCELIVLGVDDPVKVVTTTVLSRSGRSAAHVLDLLRTVLPARSFPLVRESIAWATNCHTTSDFACALGCSTRTLLRRCRAAGLMSPAKLLVWSRLILSAHEIDKGAHAIERIAEHVRFSSANDLRRAMKRSCGLRPSDVKGPAALQIIVACFALACCPRAAGRTSCEATHYGIDC
jgi:AraC-like DNA-binding protein